jgi:hypothetical protein
MFYCTFALVARSERANYSSAKRRVAPEVTRRKQQKMGHSALKDVFNKSSFWFWKSLE